MAYNGEDRKQILKLTEQVGTLSGKVDQMEKNITNNLHNLNKRVIEVHDSVKETLKSHEDRININEDSIAQMKGKTAGISFTISMIVSLIGLAITFFKHLFK